MKFAKFVFPVLLCVCFLGLFSQVQNISAMTITPSRVFGGLTEDGTIRYIDDDYGVAWVSSWGEVVDNHEDFYVGQAYNATYELYRVDRGFVFFDTSMIPDDAVLLESGTYLSLRVFEDHSDTNFNIYIQWGGEYPHDPLQDGDYDKTHYTLQGGYNGTSGLVEGGWWNITLTATGRGWINKQGITKFVLRSSRDIEFTVPTGYEYVRFFATENGSDYAPQLHVHYQVEGNRYIVHGPFFETGAVANCTANVTLYSKTENPQSFVLDGSDGEADTVTVDVEQPGFYFQWNASWDELGAHYRSYYLSTVDFDEFWVFVADPSRAYAIYTIAFLDLAGVLQSYPYVSVQRYVNGLKIVEKQKVDADKKVTFYVEAYSSYTILLSDTITTYTFGDITFADTASITLTVRAVDFPKEVLYTYKYVRIYGERAFGTPYGTITIFFQDISNQTNSVTVWIMVTKNWTVASYDVLTTDSFVYEWSSAENGTDYSVVLTVDHQLFGVYCWKQYFPMSLSDMPWGLDFLGKLPFNTAYVIPAILIIFFGAAFSVLNAEVGAVVMVVVAAILTYMGWIPITSTVLVTAFTFAVIMAIVYAKRRIQT